MKYIFLIGTEHQLSQVEFASIHFKIPKDDVILIIQGVDNDSLYKKVMAENSYVNILFFSNWVFKDLILKRDRFKHFIAICNTLKDSYKTLVFLASHYSDDSTFIALSILKPIRFYLMDEGTASYGVVNKRRSLNLMLILKLFIKSILYQLRLREPGEIAYFTKFNLVASDNDKIELYEIPKLENTLISFEKQFGFLGSSVVEVGVMDLTDYLFYLSKIAVQYNNLELIYYQHRKEDGDKLDRIRDMGFKIVNLGYPYEKHFSSQEYLPEILGSFYTTSVLINISERYLNIPKLNIFVFPFEKLKKQKDVFEDILNDLKQDHNLNFIHFENTL